MAQVPTRRTPTGSCTHDWWECHMVQTLESSVGVSFSVKLSLCILSSLHALNWCENLGPHQSLGANVYCSFIHHCQNLEVTRTFFNRWTDTESLARSYSAMPFSNKEEGTIETWIDVDNLKRIVLSERCQLKRLHGSTFMTFWKRQNHRDSKQVSGYLRIRDWGGEYRLDKIWNFYRAMKGFCNDVYMILWMCWNPENFLEKKWTLIYTNNNIKNAFRRLENPRIESRMCQNNLTGIKTHETTSWKGVGEKALTQLRKWVVLLRLNAKGTAPAPPHSCVIASHGVQGAVPVPLHTLPGAELSTGGQKAGPFPYWKGRSVLCVVATKCLQVSRLNKKKQQGQALWPTK